MALVVNQFRCLYTHIDPSWILATSSAFALGLIVRGLLRPRKGARIVRSPRITLLPGLSEEEQAKLPYPLDSFPGARDVATPYGTIRVYEFGPESGRKVLFVHGISTPCLSLGAVASGLAEKGCRVLLFDLFGRGFSDNPVDLPHDLRLFTTQILLALSSSPLPWTGSCSGKFSIVGYSLGGGIATGFTSYFTDLVDSLVLIAPAGLIRARHFSRTNKVLYSEGVIPEPILMHLVKRRLKRPISGPRTQAQTQDDTVSVEEAIQSETNIEANSTAPLSHAHPDITLERAVAHQVENHHGFPSAFMSSIRYGPIQDQHPLWQKIGRHLTNTKSKALVVLGTRDGIIHAEELQEDAAAVLDNNVEFRLLEAAHDVPVTRGDQIVDHIWSFWNTT
ncbi:hypothetical protein DV737_g3035, partial [Chaetothyriales sp. CBS 132003]